MVCQKKQVCHHRRRWCNREVDLPRELSAFSLPCGNRVKARGRLACVLSVLRWENEQSRRGAKLPKPGWQGTTAFLNSGQQPADQILKVDESGLGGSENRVCVRLYSEQERIFGVIIASVEYPGMSWACLGCLSVVFWHDALRTWSKVDMILTSFRERRCRSTSCGSQEGYLFQAWSMRGVSAN